MKWMSSPFPYQTWSTRPVATSSPGHSSLLILVTFPYGQGSVHIRSNLKPSVSEHNIKQTNELLPKRVASWGFHGRIASQAYFSQCESLTNKKIYEDMITYLPSGYSIGSKAPSSFSISPIVECRHAIKMLPGPSYDLIVLATHLALVRLQCVSTVRRRSLARGRTVSNARPCAPSAEKAYG